MVLQLEIRPVSCRYFIQPVRQCFGLHFYSWRCFKGCLSRVIYHRTWPCPQSSRMRRDILARYGFIDPDLPIYCAALHDLRSACFHSNIRWLIEDCARARNHLVRGLKAPSSWRRQIGKSSLSAALAGHTLTTKDVPLI